MDSQNIGQDMEWKQDTTHGAYVGTLAVEYHSDTDIRLRDLSKGDEGATQSFKSEQEAIQGFQQCLTQAKAKATGS